MNRQTQLKKLFFNMLLSARSEEALQVKGKILHNPGAKSKIFTALWKLRLSNKTALVLTCTLRSNRGRCLCSFLTFQINTKLDKSRTALLHHMSTWWLHKLIFFQFVSYLLHSFRELDSFHGATKQCTYTLLQSTYLSFYKRFPIFP